MVKPLALRKKVQQQRVTVLNETLWLSSGKSVFWEEGQTLIVSDCHFGKTGHFRKAGIAVPQSVYKKDLQQLVSQLQFFKPRVLLIVGDLFHSEANKELDWFVKWRNNFPQLQIVLVQGNHDILGQNWYRQAGIDVKPGVYTAGPFAFCHDAADLPDNGRHGFVFSGHIHPGVILKGAGKQSMRLPCFYFTPAQCILPAFGNFTGLASMRRKRGHQVYAIAGNSIISL